MLQEVLRTGPRQDHLLPSRKAAPGDLGRPVRYGDHMDRKTQLAFYGSPAWKHCREAYFRKAGGLCEDCLARGMITAGEEVHHKVFVTADNINDPNITLNPDNLVLLCHDCHMKRHGRYKRYRVGPNGEVFVRE